MHELTRGLWAKDSSEVRAAGERALTRWKERTFSGLGHSQAGIKLGLAPEARP
jgi:hypothetical protein